MGSKINLKQVQNEVQILIKFLMISGLVLWSILELKQEPKSDQNPIKSDQNLDLTNLTRRRAEDGLPSGWNRSWEAGFAPRAGPGAGTGTGPGIKKTNKGVIYIHTYIYAYIYIYIKKNPPLQVYWYRMVVRQRKQYMRNVLYMCP